MVVFRGHTIELSETPINIHVTVLDCGLGPWGGAGGGAGNGRIGWVQGLGDARLAMSVQVC